VPCPSAYHDRMKTQDFKMFLEPDLDYGGYSVVWWFSGKQLIGVLEKSG
jgi:hypothetical protein